jgi:hypothetical protein
MSRFLPFVDWLTIKQRHAPDSLIVVSDGHIICADSEMKKIEWETLKGKQVKGSHETSLRLRCDGTEVTLSGNVGRFGRPDNLFNLGWDETIQKANRILALHDLPPFTPGEQVLKMSPSEYDRKNQLFLAYTGATVSNIHLTANLSTGSLDDAQRVIDWLDGQSMSHIKKGRVGSSTAQFGTKSGRKLLKFYIKSKEMLAHAKNAAERQVIEQGLVYRFASTLGVVRAELECHRLMLRDHGLRYLGEITMEKLTHLFEQNVEILDRVKVDASSLDIAALPAKVRLTAEAYLRGSNLKAMMNERTWYRHAKILREYGIDIAEPHNVKAFPIKLSNRPVEIQQIHAPDWYWLESAERLSA